MNCSVTSLNAYLNNLDERTKQDFLIYANSVIKSRAIPSVEDNLKPIHRKILYTLWEDKVYDTSKTKKCATEAGRALAYSPHGDASVYGAMVRMAQWWKLRYPLLEIQGNAGNLLGDGAAASRYTECRLSPIGMMMMEDINKDCVEFKPNYDNTTTEPVSLPSKFPYILCGNNSGIAVGMSSDLVSHNFTEVCDAINHYLDNKNCTILDLLKFIKGPDFPTGGQIINGEDLLNIYSKGQGAVKVRAHYDIKKQGTKTLLIFHDLPYGVEIDSGVKEPLKKLVTEDGYEVFEDISVKKAGPRNFDITITLGRNANVAECLNILFAKTRLADTIKINQTLIVNGEPKTLNLKDLIKYWVDYRSDIIKHIAQNDYNKTNHKLTVTIGLQKCMSDIDKLINLIRNSDSRAAAKTAIIAAFELNDEQAEAVLDMKLSRLSRLDLTELDDTKNELESNLAALSLVINDENERYRIIKKDLVEIKKKIGSDERLTEITYSRPMIVQGGNVVGTTSAEEIAPVIKKEFLIYTDGVIGADEQVSANGGVAVQNNLRQVKFAYNKNDIIGYTSSGETAILGVKIIDNLIGGIVSSEKKDKVVSLTKKGNIKVSLASEYKWTKSEKLMKLKDDDELVYADKCSDNDFIIIYDGNDKILKLAIKDLPVASKATLGTKTGFTDIVSASVVSDTDILVCVDKTNKGKFVSVKDFNTDSRGNKGQSLNEGTLWVKVFESGRDNIYVVPKVGKAFAVNKNKVSIKSRTATGASISPKVITYVI